MKLSVTDAYVVIRRKANSLTLTKDYTFDVNTFNSVTDPYVKLVEEDNSFFSFHHEILNSYRAGPSLVSPTRYMGDLRIELWDKEGLDEMSAYKELEEVANEFAESTIEGIRFRTFTPMPTRTTEGFTIYSGIIDFDFELYRGG